MLKQNNVVSKAAIFLSLLLFTISLTQTAFYTNSPTDGKFSSLFSFGFGWAGFLSGNFSSTLIWMANPVYLLALIFYFQRHRSRAIATGITSLILALFFFTQDTIMTNESGLGPVYAVTLAAGFWLWIAAIACLLIGILLYENQERLQYYDD